MMRTTKVTEREEMIKKILNGVKNFFVTPYDSKKDIKDRDNSRGLADYALAAFLGVLLFSIYYRFCRNYMYSSTLNDLKDHAATAAGIFKDTLFQTWLDRPYLMWFLCVKVVLRFTSIHYDDGVSFVCALFALACYIVTFWMLNRLNIHYFKEKAKAYLPAVLAAVLGFVQPLFMDWFNSTQYEGQFSINPIFNAPHMAVKCFGLFCVAVAIDILRRNRGKRTVFFSETLSDNRLYVILAAALFLSVFTKPTFVFMFIPAGVVYVLTLLVSDLIVKDKAAVKGIGKLVLKMTLACIPAGLYILIEYLAFYFWGDSNGNSRIAIGSLFEAWSMYTPNIFVSVIIAIIFPLWMVCTDFRYFWQSIEGRLSVICYLTGFFEFAILIETGYKEAHLNFAWEYMSGMLVLFVIAAWRLLMCTNGFNGNGTWQKIRVSIGWFLLFLQLYAGFFYMNNAAYLI